MEIQGEIRFTKGIGARSYEVIGRDHQNSHRVLRTAVAIGDWSRRDGMLRGKPSGPVKKFKLELQKHAVLFRGS